MESKTQQRIKEKRAICSKKKYWTCRSLFGYNNCFFYVIIGARCAGKSYSIMDRFIRDYKQKGIPFYWLRLTDKIAQSMLANNAMKFIDADLVRKYDLELTVKGNNVYDHGVKMAEIMGISNFYSKKGTATFDCEWNKGYNICLDECQREVGEAVRFDLSYALVNTLENYVRDSKEKLKIVFICNYTETVSDVLNLFNFIPENFGRYYLKSKKAVIEYIPPTDAYVERRTGCVADILMPQNSTFTNKKIFDKTLLYKGRLEKPTCVLDFGDEKYTIWDGTIIKAYCNEKVQRFAMKPYTDGCMYSPAFVKNIVTRFDNRQFKYRDLITQQRFTLALSKVRKSK